MEYTSANCRIPNLCRAHSETKTEIMNSYQAFNYLSPLFPLFLWFVCSPPFFACLFLLPGVFLFWLFLPFVFCLVLFLALLRCLFLFASVLWLPLFAAGFLCLRLPLYPPADLSAYFGCHYILTGPGSRFVNLRSPTSGRPPSPPAS